MLQVMVCYDIMCFVIKIKDDDNAFMSENHIKQLNATIDLPITIDQPKLSIDAQIAHLSEIHGVSFDIKGVDAAKIFLTKNNYYHKIKAYSNNFSTYQRNDHPLFGKFCNLDFEYLVELSVLDMYLRRIIITMSLDIEHFLKVKLINDITCDDSEDAYSIVNQYITACISETKRKEISEKLNNYYYNRYNQHSLNEIPAWELVEILSFGDFITFYELYYSFHPTRDSMVNNLKPAQWLRNAAAHNNCIINDLNVPEKSTFQINKTINTFVSKIDGISSTTREKKLSNESIHDFVVMLYVYNKVVTSPKVKEKAMAKLKEFVDGRMVLNKHYFNKNGLLHSSYNFFKKIVDFFASDVVY